MDENFLLHRKRAMRLLERMKAEKKAWGMAVFASANAIRQYKVEELVELGVSWIWMGLESPRSSYAKLEDTDSHELTHTLREHGIRVQGSTIIGLEHHTPDNIREEIEYAVAHNTDFHQFMLYTPVPGTPLFEEMSEQGRMLEGIDVADIHGQDKFNFRHAAISRDDSKRFLDWAFWRDFERNGPSLYRMCETMLQGWRRYKNYPDLRVRERFARENAKLRTVYSAALVGRGTLLPQSERGRQPADPRTAARDRQENSASCRGSLSSRDRGRSCCGPRAGKISDWRRA